MTRPTESAGRFRDGFTLIEMLVVTAFTAGLLIAAVTFYLQIARASTAATARTEDARRAAAVLDRVARDLEATVLVTRPEEVDAFSHPWLFLAESRGAGPGADRLKFDTRSHRPRTSDTPESDLQVVAYFLSPGDEEGDVLLRWSSPRLPEQLDRSFPAADDPGVQVLAERVAVFGVRLLDEEGQWTDAWDSFTLARSSQLPAAVEVSLAFLPPPAADPKLVAGAPEPPLFTRQVLLPVRPLDLKVLLAGGPGDEGKGEEDDEETADRDCVTVEQCVARNPGVFALLYQTSPDLRAVIDSLGGQCWADHAGAVGVAVEGCQ